MELGIQGLVCTMELGIQGLVSVELGIQGLVSIMELGIQGLVSTMELGIQRNALCCLTSTQILKMTGRISLSSRPHSQLSCFLHSALSHLLTNAFWLWVLTHPLVIMV